MKKIIIVLCAGFAAIVAPAQRQMNAVTAPSVTTNSNLRKDQITPFRAQSSSADRSASYWLCYALQLDDPNGPSPGMASADYLMLFPDSNIIVGQYTTGQTAYAQFHKAATMLAPGYMPVQGLTPTTPYTLDSLGIVYAYLRNTTSTVTDTLVVQVIRHDNNLVWDLTNATYQDITYTHTNNAITPSQVLTTYTYLLTETDSSNYPAEIFFNTSAVPQQAAGNRIGVVVSFKPGYSYTSTDSIQDKNSFYLFSYENNGIGTDPTFYGTIADPNSDLNCSYALPSSVRYNFNPNGWNGYFIPTWAYTTGYAYENHVIEFKVSELVGINENNSAVSVSTYPNPANQNVVINYTMKQDADVVIQVTDITGRIVMTQREGNRATGEYRAELNTGSLSEGTYFINVIADGVSNNATKIVVKH